MSADIVERALAYRPYNAMNDGPLVADLAAEITRLRAALAEARLERDDLKFSDAKKTGLLSAALSRAKSAEDDGTRYLAQKGATETALAAEKKARASLEKLVESKDDCAVAYLAELIAEAREQLGVLIEAADSLGTAANMSMADDAIAAARATLAKLTAVEPAALPAGGVDAVERERLKTKCDEFASWFEERGMHGSAENARSIAAALSPATATPSAKEGE